MCGSATSSTWLQSSATKPPEATREPFDQSAHDCGWQFINGLYEAEVTNRRSLRRTRKEVGWATLNWVDGSNNRRLF